MVRTSLTFGKRKVGEMDGDTFYTIRKPEHYMKIFQGYGVSEKVLNFIEKKGVEKIVIVYKGTRGSKVFNSTVKEFKESSKEFTFNGSDKQKFLSEVEMEEIKNESL
jgi:glycerol dehydrogenase-like iron-containing ADH family enzyme